MADYIDTHFLSSKLHISWEFRISALTKNLAICYFELLAPTGALDVTMRLYWSAGSNIFAQHNIATTVTLDHNSSVIAAERSSHNSCISTQYTQLIQPNSNQAKKKQLTQLDTIYRRLTLPTSQESGRPYFVVFKSLYFNNSWHISADVLEGHDTNNRICLTLSKHEWNTIQTPYFGGFYNSTTKMSHSHFLWLLRTIPIVPPSTHLLVQYVAWIQEETLDIDWCSENAINPSRNNVSIYDSGKK